MIKKADGSKILFIQQKPISKPVTVYLLRSISYWLPLLFLCSFYLPGLFFNKVRIEPAYHWSVNHPGKAEFNSYNQDKVKAGFPFWMYKRRVIKEKLSVQWNDYQYSGHPLWPEAVFTFFSFRTLLTLFFPPIPAYTISQLLQGIMLILFANLILKLFKLRSFPRTISIIALTLSSESLAHQQNSYGEVWIWLLAGVWILTSVWKFGEKKHFWIVMGAAGGLMWGMGHYLNHPLYQFFSLTVLALYALVLSVISREYTFRLPDYRIIASFCLMVFLSIGLSIWQWLPVLELLSHSFRSVSSKGGFLPNFVRFMPYLLPRDAGLREIIHAYFGFRTVPSNFRIPYINLILDGSYLSMTFYFLIGCLLLYKPVRQKTVLLWLPYLLIVGGYNVLALFMRIPGLAHILMQLPLIKSVNLTGLAVYASLFLYLLSGFGVNALVSLAKSKKGPALLLGWLVFLLVYTGGALIISAKIRSVTQEDLQLFLQTAPQQWHPAVIGRVTGMAELVIKKWSPLHPLLLGTLLLLFVEAGCLFFLSKKKYRRKALFILMCSLAITGLVSISHKTTWTKAGYLIPRLEQIERIKKASLLEPARITVIPTQKSVREQINDRAARQGEQFSLGLGDYIRYYEEPFLPAMSLLYQVEDVRGISALNLLDYTLFLQGIYEVSRGETYVFPRLGTELEKKYRVYQRSWDLLNTKWILTGGEINFPGYTRKEQGLFNIYYNNQALDRVWFSDKVNIINSRELLFKEMTKPGWDLREVLLEVQPREKKEAGKTRYGFIPEVFVKKKDGTFGWLKSDSLFSHFGYKMVNHSAEKKWNPVPGASAKIEWLHKEQGKRILKVDADGKGLLFFSEIFYPGWQVKIDGKPGDLYRADYTFMAVPLEKGCHTVELYFSSFTYKAGRIISIFFLICVILAFLFYWGIKFKKKAKNGMLKRDVTNVINWILDNLVPPAVRDSRFFLPLVMSVLFGAKKKYFLDFKEKAFSLSKEEFSAYYKELADTFIKRKTDLNEKSIRRILHDIKGKKVLDVGCGTGYLAEVISQQKDTEVTGLDIVINPNLQKGQDISFIQGNIEELPFEDNFFDTVISTHTLEHVQDLHKAVSEIRRVAREQVLIVVPRQREYKYTFDMHIHFFPYLFSFRKVMGNEKGICEFIDNDIYYSESKRKDI